jgi:hypothetical protein
MLLLCDLFAVPTIPLGITDENTAASSTQSCSLDKTFDGHAGGGFMDRIRDILLYVVAAFAMLSFACAVYQAMNEKHWSAGILGGIAVACTFLVFFPRLEMFKAFGVEARLSQTLDRAQEILQELQRLSVITARTSYMTMAWGNRMGAPAARDKQAILDEVDRQLADLNVSRDERSALQRPYVKLIGFDFYRLFVGLLDRYGNWKADDLVRQLNANHTEQAVLARERFTKEQSDWRAKALGNDVYAKLATYKFEEEMSRAAPDGWLDDKERKAAETLRAHMVRMFDECEKKGGYTIEAAEFYDRYHDLGGYDKKIKELFGVNPSDVR